MSLVRALIGEPSASCITTLRISSRNPNRIPIRPTRHSPTWRASDQRRGPDVNRSPTVPSISPSSSHELQPIDARPTDRSLLRPALSHADQKPNDPETFTTRLIPAVGTGHSSDTADAADPRGQTAMATGQASPDAKNIHARGRARSLTNGIVPIPSLSKRSALIATRSRSKSRRWHMVVRAGHAADPGQAELFHHTDRNRYADRRGHAQSDGAGSATGAPVAPH
jgi:hypothetical protein